jgi:2-oxoglutarate dehydrogenase E2 component (dihydrolipoamide succinyltransferase)
MMQENNLSVDDIIAGLKRIGKEEVEAVMNSKNTTGHKESIKKPSSRDSTHEPMSQLRKKLSKRLVAVKNETAMLTTFNEADMTAIIELRNKYQKSFTEKHNIKLGFMSFFTKAASIALLQFPKVNSMLDGDDIVVPSFVDIGIAVQTEKGLMVPILRNIESMGLAEIEKTLNVLAEKAKSGRLSIEDMTGGTFTITNGGVFGSLFSTPIINPPQAAILGMHNIVERPVAISGKVEIRPMMYLALSYDHRLIDGKDSVSCLFKIKELIESPWKMLVDRENPEKLLLGL